jgi:hypothetical protein
VLDADLAWLSTGAQRPGLRQHWLDRLAQARQHTTDLHELAMLRELEILVVQSIP